MLRMQPITIDQNLHRPLATMVAWWTVDSSGPKAEYVESPGLVVDEGKPGFGGVDTVVQLPALLQLHRGGAHHASLQAKKRHIYI